MTGESSTEATPPDLEAAPVAAPLVVASPAVESAPTLAITDGKKKMLLYCVWSKGSSFLVSFH